MFAENPARARLERGHQETDGSRADWEGVVSIGEAGRESKSAGTSVRSRTNRENAQHSTGPRTPAGRSTSSKNATKHGLLSREVVLGEEDRDAYNGFARTMRRALAPVGALERELAARAIAAAWRLRRIERIETLILEAGRKNWKGEEVGLSSGFVTYCVNGDAYSKLSRYEAGIERSFFRSLHELQRLQAARLGREVSVPSVVDVDVSVRADGPEVASRAS